MHHGTLRREESPVEDVRMTLAEIGAASERLTATAAKLTDDDLNWIIERVKAAFVAAGPMVAV